MKTHFLNYFRICSEEYARFWSDYIFSIPMSSLTWLCALSNSALNSYVISQFWVFSVWISNSALSYSLKFNVDSIVIFLCEGKQQEGNRAGCVSSCTQSTFHWRASTCIWIAQLCVHSRGPCAGTSDSTYSQVEEKVTYAFCKQY